MPKPLFPENDEPLFIKQGDYGDCFVLAGFESIYNSGVKGREALKSIFSYSPDGLNVRLEHNSQSQYLKPNDFILKYGYKRVGRQDVFTVYWDTLEEIASYSQGVETNAFALPVLGRIISNYFAFPWNRWQRRGSLDAYNFNIEQRHPKKSSSEFMADLLGIKVDNVSLSVAIRLKMLDQKLPVYVCMQYNSASKDVRHRFHALIIDTVYSKEDGSGEHTLGLINPWDNQSRELYSTDDIAIKEAFYSVFIVDPKAHQERMYIAYNPPLFELVCQANSGSLKRLLPYLVGRLCRLYGEMPYLPELINPLTASERGRLYVYIAATSELKEDFINHVLYTFRHTRVVEIIIQHEPHSSLETYDILANIALNEKNSTVYHYLVNNNFDFALFLQVNNDQKDKFVRALLHLEEQFYPLSDVAKLRRIQSYIDKLGTGNEFRLSFSKGSVMLAPFIDQATKNKFTLLLAREALRIIYDHADKISKFQFSFAKCVSTKEVALHYKTLLSQVERMGHHPDLMEASRAILGKYSKRDPSIVSVTTKIRAEIKTAKLAQENTIQLASNSQTDSHRPSRLRLFSNSINAAETARAGTISTLNSSFV